MSFEDSSFSASFSAPPSSSANTYKLRADLLLSYKECSERGLYQAAKWYAKETFIVKCTKFIILGLQKC